MAAKLIWGSDLYKGYKIDKKNLNGSVKDILPFQMLSLEEKTIDWIKAVADFYDAAGWVNVEKRANKIQKNYMMRYGKLNMTEYDVSAGDLAKAAGIQLQSDNPSPLEQFYSLAPNFVDVLRGEFIKRDNTWTVEAVDPQSKAQMFAAKQEQFEQIVTEMAMIEKQQTLAKMGLTQESDPEQYQQQMEAAMKRLTDIELASKDFRTTGVQWAEKVLKIHEKRYNLHELEPDGFESSLISDSEFWHIDLLDDDFKIELLNPKWVDSHKGPGVKYVSDGDYFLWFDFMSTGDIVNKLGRRMKEDDLKKLKEVFLQTSHMLVPDQLKERQGEYYDTSKSWLEATDLNRDMNDSLLGQELAYNYMRSPNFDHNIDTDMFSPTGGRTPTGHPHMFRVMRLYWRSMKKVGWLTKINRDGTREQPDWVDENYRVTVEPKYDKSRVKEETKDNLLYGEHIDWTWAPDWRHVIKISPNGKHSFWLDEKNKMDNIYIDGASVKFQFKGRENPFDSLPPVEGCFFSYLNTEPHSFIDRIRPHQIIYNICMNKVPKKFMKDYGNKITFDTRSMMNNSTSNTANSVDPVEAYDEMLRESDILPYKLTRESLEGMGQPALPQVLQLSTAQEAMVYMQIADNIKWAAGENVGITRQRLGGQKPGETATGINQGIVYSETQTEKYFEQHANLMQRFRQRMLDAAQYYSTQTDLTQDVYMNDRNENVMLSVEGLENLLPHYNIFLQSRANVRSALQTISNFLQNENTLPIKPSAKLEAMIENSIPKIMTLVRESEIEQEQQQAAQQSQEQQMQQQQLETQERMQQEKLAWDAEQRELDRQSAEEIATIRALGGVQTDADANGQTDAQANLDNYFKQQELQDKRSLGRDTLAAKRQTDIDKMLVDREKSEKDLQKEKIKGEYALKVAKENKTNAEIKRKSK